MTEEAALKFELNSSLRDWTEFTSPEVELAGFKWFVSGEYIGCGAEKIKRFEDGRFSYNCKDTKFALRNTVIHCTPVERRETSIWSCEAKGEIVAIVGVMTRITMNYPKLWSHHFTFRNPESVALEIDFNKKFSEIEIYCIESREEGNFSQLEFRVKVSSHAKFDLCLPENERIKSPEDAAKVTVEGKTLWLSKEALGGASPFFRAYFNNDFKEKRDGEFPLKDVKFDEFMPFITIIYGVHFDVDKTSLQYLLRLEDMYQCEIVRSKCHAFLVATDTLTHQEKLRIGDRFRFEDVIDMAIEKMNVQDLMAIGREVQCETYSHKTISAIFRAISERRSS